MRQSNRVVILMLLPFRGDGTAFAIDKDEALMDFRKISRSVSDR
jgi:hypothetical protein